jgi:hypothetical protein
MEAMEAKKKAKRTILVLRKKSSPLGPLQRKAKHSRTTQYEAMGRAGIASAQRLGPTQELGAMG